MAGRGYASVWVRETKPCHHGDLGSVRRPPVACSLYYVVLTDTVLLCRFYGAVTTMVTTGQVIRHSIHSPKGLSVRTQRIFFVATKAKLATMARPTIQL